MKLFTFGKKVAKYDVLVLNEREIRAAAGILFLFAFIAFMNVWFLGNFFFMKLFVIGFLVDFIVRLLINPMLSPSMILGRLVTQNQTVEYVGAPQKRFAWMIGLVLAATMFWLVVINNIVGPINMFLCIACLTFLFFESAFGICLGCHVYNLFHKEKAQLCPGGVCETYIKEPIQSTSILHLGIIVIFIATIFWTQKSLSAWETKQREIETQVIETQSITEECEVPQWAKDIGHEEMYKLHQGCE